METIAKTAFFLLAFVVIAKARPSNFSMPTKCAGQSYCTVKHTSYPQARVDELAVNMAFSSGKPTLGQRDGETFDHEMNVCQENSDENPIYEIVDEHGEVRVVIQATNGFQQKLKIKICTNPGLIVDATQSLTQETVDNVRLTCEQLLMEHPFMVLSKDWER